ncbi:MAG: hypothetical protein BWK80_59835 [Desulfobacteraceae bacterium IS3]|nr:MAG: hypothetical protein BWK80_59835 [Desulfobacteraceae bacterium IS3]
MSYRIVEIEETDYQYLEKYAHTGGITIQYLIRQLIANHQRDENTDENAHHKKSRWAEFSERIRKNPPLSGSGDYLHNCSQEFREDFEFGHEEE